MPGKECKEEDEALKLLINTNLKITKYFHPKIGQHITIFLIFTNKPANSMINNKTFLPFHPLELSIFQQETEKNRFSPKKNIQKEN